MATQITGIERRQHTRRVLRTTAHVLLPDNKRVEVRTFDISAGGLGIVAAINPKAGSTFNIRLNLVLTSTGSTTIEAPVEVTHSVFGSVEQGFKIGLRFLKLESSAISAIALFLEE